MGRRRSDFKCPKCGRLGSFRPEKPCSNKQYPLLKYDYPCVEHYDSFTKKKRTCYIKKSLRKKELEAYQEGKISKDDFWLKQSSEVLKILEKKSSKFQKYIEHTITDTVIGNSIVSSFNKRKYEMIALDLAPSAHLALSNIKSRTPEQEKLLVWSKKLIDYNERFSKQFFNVRKLVKQYKRTGRFPLNGKQSVKFLEQNKLAYQWLCNVPFNNELAVWGRKYYKPIAEEKRRKLKENLSDAAFGSNKYSSYFTGIGTDHKS